MYIQLYIYVYIYIYVNILIILMSACQLKCGCPVTPVVAHVCVIKANNNINHSTSLNAQLICCP